MSEIVQETETDKKKGLPETGQLRWRCRRGMRELDAAMLAYLDNHFPIASQTEQAAFCELLDLPDPVIMRLVAGQAIAAEPGVHSEPSATLSTAFSGSSQAEPQTRQLSSRMQGSLPDEHTKKEEAEQGSSQATDNDRAPENDSIEQRYQSIIEKIRTSLTR